MNYLADAIDSCSKRTDKMMTGYWLAIASYIYRALHTEFEYNPTNRNEKVSAIAAFASHLETVILTIFERLLTMLYTVYTAFWVPLSQFFDVVSDR